MFMRSFVVLMALLVFSATSMAEPSWNVGPKECSECHDREYEHWKTTPHFESYKTAHKTDEAKAIVTALGEKSMKRTAECALCHYTPIRQESGKDKAKAGPSCESCHGAGSDWIQVHNDFGEGIENAADEAPDHRVKRLADAEAGGMIASRMVFDIASSCMRCHGLGNPDLEAATLTVMLDNKHPIEKDFEIVKYSQGMIRHRFVPPDVNVNSESEPAGIARLYIGGQMATIVASESVKTKVDNASFLDAQKYRIENARKNLGTLVSAVPELEAFLASSTAENARKVVAAIKDKDLSAATGSLLPAKSDYKNK